MSKAKIFPIGPNVLVKPLVEEKRSKSGIVIPETVNEERPQKGRVEAVGISTNVKVGDVVIFKKYSPDEIKIDGEEYLIMKEEDILAVIK